MRALVKLHPTIVTNEFFQQSVVPELIRAGIGFSLLPMDICEAKELPPGDIVLVIGGDGTFLSGALVASEQNIPIMGVELGHLGFLCQQPVERLPEVLQALVGGDYSIEERPVLKCTTSVGGDPAVERTAINDVVLGKSELTRLIELTVVIDGEPLATFKADGIVVASATGSTAYSLSAGGPLLEPTLAALVITPICAHTLYAKPYVVDGRRNIKLSLAQEAPAAVLSMDGRKVGPVTPDDVIAVTLKERPLKVVRLESPTFYSVLREKFGWDFKFSRARE
jgi:NAD+ kinase